MSGRIRRAVALVHDLLWAALVLAPAATFFVWLERLPKPPRRVAWDHAFDPFRPIYGRLLLHSVVGVLVLFLAEYACRRVHRWAARPTLALRGRHTAQGEHPL